MLTRRFSLSLGYDVCVAPGFAGLGAELDRLDLGRVVVVTNPTVAALHGDTLAAELGARELGRLQVPDGEAHKNLDTWRALVEALLALRVDRRVAVLAFGGGVVGDLAGFAAASTLRGLPLVQVPTTLLAAVDAAVGGKTGVNTAAGKNLVGAFHQPRLVWCATHTHRTLPERELRCGLGEVLKHAVLGGPAELRALDEAAERLAAGEPDALGEAVLASIRVKSALVEADPLEDGVRALLNLGHTLGHAIETVAGYGVLSHGEAVAIGLIAVSRYGRERGLTDPAFVAALTTLAGRLGLPVSAPPTLDAAALVRAMGFDKKRGRGMVRLVIPTTAGDVRLVPVPESELALLPTLAGVGA